MLMREGYVISLNRSFWRMPGREPCVEVKRECSQVVSSRSEAAHGLIFCISV